MAKQCKNKIQKSNYCRLRLNRDATGIDSDAIASFRALSGREFRKRISIQRSLKNGLEIGLNRFFLLSF